MSSAPAVVVKDQRGNVMAGVTVTFAITAGGGSLGTTSIATTSAGTATSASWILGTTAGANTVVAAVGTLAPVTFSATGTADVATSLINSEGNGQHGIVGTAFPLSVAVRARDKYLNGVPGVAVTFSVAAGGGSFSPATATTGATGEASSTWIAGTNPGNNVANITAQGLNTVQVTATAITACGFFFPSFFPPATRNESLTTTDCRGTGGQYRDQYRMTLGAAGAVRVSLSSTAFDTELFLRDQSLGLIAENDDESGTSNNSSLKILLTAQQYDIWATSNLSGAVGAYTLTAAAVSENVTNCEEVFIRAGVTTAQTLSATDCASGSRDEFKIHMGTGRDIRIQMKSTAFNTLLELWSPTGVRVALNDNRNSTTTDSEIVYNSGGTMGYYTIRARGASAGATGAYTLEIANW